MGVAAEISLKIDIKKQLRILLIHILLQELYLSRDLKKRVEYVNFATCELK